MTERQSLHGTEAVSNARPPDADDQNPTVVHGDFSGRATVRDVARRMVAGPTDECTCRRCRPGSRYLGSRGCGLGRGPTDPDRRIAPWCPWPICRGPGALGRDCGPCAGVDWRPDARLYRAVLEELAIAGNTPAPAIVSRMAPELSPAPVIDIAAARRAKATDL